MQFSRDTRQRADSTTGRRGLRLWNPRTRRQQSFRPSQMFHVEQFGSAPNVLYPKPKLRGSRMFHVEQFDWADQRKPLVFRLVEECNRECRARGGSMAGVVPTATRELARVVVSDHDIGRPDQVHRKLFAKSNRISPDRAEVGMPTESTVPSLRFSSPNSPAVNWPARLTRIRLAGRPKQRTTSA